MARADRPSPSPAPARTRPAGANAESATASPPAMVLVGHVRGAHGLKGALRLRPVNPDSDALFQIERVRLELESESREFRLTGATRLSARAIRITLEGVGDVDAADALKGAALMIQVADLPAAGPREFYYFQALGCEVVTTSGERVGAVAEIFSNGAHDVWVVREGVHEVLVPVIDEIVREMDFAARRIMIEPVPGLLD